jgi:hypothetical protein
LHHVHVDGPLVGQRLAGVRHRRHVSGGPNSVRMRNGLPSAFLAAAMRSTTRGVLLRRLPTPVHAGRIPVVLQGGDAGVQMIGALQGQGYRSGWSCNKDSLTLHQCDTSNVMRRSGVFQILPAGGCAVQHAGAVCFMADGMPVCLKVPSSVNEFCRSAPLKNNRGPNGS